MGGLGQLSPHGSLSLPVTLKTHSLCRDICDPT